MARLIPAAPRERALETEARLLAEAMPWPLGFARSAMVNGRRWLMVADGADIKVGAPMLAGASVRCTVLSHGRGEKVMIFKMRRRKHYQKHQGHRQNYTELRIDAIAA